MPRGNFEQVAAFTGESSQQHLQMRIKGMYISIRMNPRVSKWAKTHIQLPQPPSWSNNPHKYHHKDHSLRKYIPNHRQSNSNLNKIAALRQLILFVHYFWFLRTQDAMLTLISFSSLPNHVCLVLKLSGATLYELLFHQLHTKPLSFFLCLFIFFFWG